MCEADSKRVLIVEDDPISLQALRTILKYRGWEVEVAKTLSAAVEKLPHNPHYIILDLMLPDGHGSRILEELRRRGMVSIVVVTTGVENPAELTQMIELGAKTVIKKPLNLAQLFYTLEEPAMPAA